MIVYFKKTKHFWQPTSFRLNPEHGAYLYDSYMSYAGLHFDKVVRKKLTNTFQSICIIDDYQTKVEELRGDYPVKFKFNDLSDEAYFIMLASNGFEVGVEV